ncbi:MAG: peptidase T [Mucinivorans sp.]
MKDRLLERFMRYVAFETTSAEESENFPSTAGQLLLLDALADELRHLGCTDVERDEWGYVMATIAPTANHQDEKVIGLLAHVDTSPDMSGRGVKPQIHHNYDPTHPLQLGTSEYYLDSTEFAELRLLTSHTLITTDGTTLLGADDKAGVAEIMTAAEYIIQHPQIAHGKIRICFTPDEEVGRGVDHLDLAKFGADYGYTIDSGAEGAFEYENFNAAKALITICGLNIHPGYAKDKMVNALDIACHIHSMVPVHQRPVNTEGREGFFHLHSLSGTVDHATMEYIIRDHDRELFELKKTILARIVATQPAASLTLGDQYYNMYEVLSEHPDVIDRALGAMRRVGVSPVVSPIRGGTDGSRLSFMGLPCPNIFTGGGNMHSRYEYVSVDSMERAVGVIVELVAVGRTASFDWSRGDTEIFC